MNDRAEGARIAEAPASLPYRHMARQIEREFGGGERGVCLAFTSPDGNPVAAEVVLLLAFTLQSELQAKVLVVDAAIPVTAGGITHRLGLSTTSGYAEVVSEGLTGLDALLRPSGATNVDILPAGLAVRGGSGAGERVAMAALFDALRGRYRHVLVHVGPVEGDPDNLVGAAQADATFLVALEDHTSMRSLDGSRDLLLRYGVRDVRVVLAHGKS